MCALKTEHFELMWYGKQEARQTAYTPTTSQLHEESDQTLQSTSEHLIIEGDNLEVLKVLQDQYTSQVDLIYLDPPYNTGKNFIYHDRFSSSLTEYLS